jgi:hypothetical protein
MYLFFTIFHQNNQLPTPKRETGEFVIEQAHMAGSLNHIVGRGKQAATPKRKNHGVGVQGTQPAIAEPRNAQVQLRPS